MGHKGNVAFSLTVFLFISLSCIKSLSVHYANHSRHGYIDLGTVTQSTRLHDDKDTVAEYLARAVVEEKLKNKWEALQSETPPAISESDETVNGRAQKRVVFEKVGTLTVKEVFHYLQFFPLLYGKETDPVIFEIPVDGETFELELKNRADHSGRFDAKKYDTEKEREKETGTGTGTGTEVQTPDLSDITTAVHELHDLQLDPILKTSLESTLPGIFNAQLNDQPVFESTVTAKDTSSVITDAKRKKAFKEAVEVMASTSILGTDLSSFGPATWLQSVDGNLKTEREALETDLNTEIENDERTKLMFELTASMMATGSEAKAEWDDLVAKSIIVETPREDNPNRVGTVQITETPELSARKVFKLLQSYCDIYSKNGQIQTIFQMPIGGEERTFRLQRAPRGKYQVLLYTINADWPGTTTRGTKPEYHVMVDQVLRRFPDSQQLAKVILDANRANLDAQPDFSNLLERRNPDNTRNERGTADTIRAAVELMVTSLVAEAAHPDEEAKTTFLKDITKTIKEKGRFPEAADMPTLGVSTKKTGRSPAMDEVARSILEEVHSTGVQIHDAFSNDNFPARKRPGGTELGRQYTKEHGDKMVPSYLIRKRAAGDHDGELIAKKARKSCTGSVRRKKRSACLLEELEEKNMVNIDDKSIEITDDKIKFDVFDRRDAKKRYRIKLRVTADELATPKLIQDDIVQSKRNGASKSYAKVHRGLAVHGLVFSTIGAIDYFSRGDYVRGGVAVSQSLHTLGGLTGFNEIVSKAGKRLMRYTALKVAKGLKMERGLVTLSDKMERFMEKGVGKLMGDIPGVGLVFDIYFIKQDIDSLAKLDLNNPDDVKMLPLRVVDLVLDVDTTVLNLIGTFCPEAEVVTEPLIIVLSIIRMAIDDFYIDIMDEMEKVNWNSPWAGLEFIGALVKGFVEGAADFLSGGLRREMSSYQAQVDSDRKQLSDLRNADNYYTIVGNKGESKTITFTQGRLSGFGGYINFKLLDNGWASLVIGDVSGDQNKIVKKFKVDDDLTDIVLGVGESRDFKYQTETAKLWFVIPIKHYSVICGANLHEKSLYGTYYGNSKNNKFFAVQNPKTASTTSSEGCNYGKFDLKFVTGNYHYNLYGRGGDDIFYLGPQISKVTGGEGSDVYVIQSDGGKSIIDNFSEDDKHDMVVINVAYDDIRCIKSGTNLDLTYSSNHHMRINNWFTPGDPNYYRHMSFRSREGVIFVPKAFAEADVKCTAVALDKSSEETSQSISIQGSSFSQIKQVVGSDQGDTIIGNDLNNILDGGNGPDRLTGGRNEDTYIIRAHEGCDTINNDADDFGTTTDVVVFDVIYKNIDIRVEGNSLSVFDRDNRMSSCLRVENWVLGERYQHMIFTSSDHVVFKVKTLGGNEEKSPLVLDYSSSITGVNVDLSDSPKSGAIHPPGYDNVATVSDSPHDDRIIGNSQSNFLSCTGGNDYLKGGQGSDNYVVKKTCQSVQLNNADSREKVDLLLLEDDFKNLRIQKQNEHLRITTLFKTPIVVLLRWFRGSKHQHLWLRTKDGITAVIDGNVPALHAVEVSKDPTECQCKQSNCPRKVVKYDLSQKRWENVTRFQLQSSYCSYNIIGNALNNYIDPGSGNGYNYQHLMGNDGSDTYILNHGYGEFNKINNFARDKKTDIIQLGLELDDIRFYFHGKYDVILASKSRPSSLSVRIVKYFRGPKYQHLQIITSDKVSFQIQRQHPFMNVTSVDRSTSDSPQNISPDQESLLYTSETIQGSLTQSNVLVGTHKTKELIGGAQADTLRGGPSNDILEGREGDDVIHGGLKDDIIFGGQGDDSIYGGEGQDYIYGGDGVDLIDGGEGSDTVAFKGDGYRKKGVHVDLSIGFGKGADAEGDTYKSIENVYGTIHDDFLSDSDSNNNLYGLHGNDVLLVHGGNDKLVGGEGSDRYVLYEAYGVKVIDNYATDKAEDTISLVHLSSEEVCPFLIGKDLYFQIQETSYRSTLNNNQKLTIVIQNWGVSAKYKHLNVALKDKVWTSYALWRVKHKFDQMDTKVRHIALESNFQVSFDGSSARLSWAPLPGPPLDRKTKFILIQMDTQNPKGLTETELTGNLDVMSISSLDPRLHYVFALYLKKCSGTISSSFSLTTFGGMRACPQISLEHAQVSYTPVPSLSHGTRIDIVCMCGFKLNNEQSTYNGICLDSHWQPSIPSCQVINHCPTLTEPSHGKLSISGYQEGAVAHYECLEGFKLNGAQERTCNHNGRWHKEDPICVHMRCVQLPNVDHGEVEPCEAMRPRKEYGTLESPNEGFCARLTCDEHHLESYGSNNEPENFIQQCSLGIPRGARVCRDGKWIGYTKAFCEPKVRLDPELTVETWCTKSGGLQNWNANNWQYDFDASKDKVDIVCSDLSKDYGIPTFIKTQLLSTPGVRAVVIRCPKIRFVNKITPYEGTLEVLLRNRWTRFCYSDYGTTDHQAETDYLCETLTANPVKSSLVQHNTGWTDYRLACSPTAGLINYCNVERYRQECPTMLRCRQRCSNDYPVPNGKSRCTGKYEADSCDITCSSGFTLRGDRRVNCVDGKWKNQQGEDATSQCV